MTAERTFYIFAFCLLPFALLSKVPLAPRFEFRVVFASYQKLASQLDEAGRDGFGCLLVARNEGAGAPGVVVWLAREAGGTPQPSTFRVLTGGANLQVPLDRAAGEGFRLCGLVLTDAPPAATVAVMSRPSAGAATPWHYRTETLLNYKESLTRLNAAGRDGFVPVAAEAIDNNRVPDLRNWMVAAERSDAAGVAAVDVVVHSDTGPDGLQKKLNDRGHDGYRVDLLWKEGNDFVAMLSRATAGPTTSHTYAVAKTPLSSFHSLSRLYLADFPYLQERLLVSDTSVPASVEVIDDPLPGLGAFPDRAALGTLASHIQRNQGFVPASSRISRSANGPWRLTTIIVRRD